MYAPQLGVLFCGDSVVAGPGGRLRCSRGANTSDEGQAAVSMEAQLALDAPVVCSGHGPTVRTASGRGSRGGRRRTT